MVQRCLNFGEASVELELNLYIIGLSLYIKGPAKHRLLQVLDQVGFTEDDFLQDLPEEVVVPVRQLPKLLKLPSKIGLVGDYLFNSFVELLSRDIESFPATVDLDRHGDIVVSWFDVEGQPKMSTIEPRGFRAMLILPIVFVATLEAWHLLKKHVDFQIPSAVASLDAKQPWVNFTTYKPQLLEALAIPGLWKESTTKYHTTINYLKSVQENSNLIWSQIDAISRQGHNIDAEPVVSKKLPLANHIKNALPTLVKSFTKYKTVVLAWDPSLGRRIGALALAYHSTKPPYIVIGPNYGAWAWQRLFRTFELSLSLNPNVEADGYFISYQDDWSAVASVLNSTKINTHNAVFILDDITADVANNARIFRTGLNLTDCYVIGVTASWSDDSVGGYSIMNKLRPPEFPVLNGSYSTRYPKNTESSMLEHSKSYVFPLDRRAVPVLTWRFQHNQVVPLAFDATFKQEQARLYTNSLVAGNAVENLELFREFTSHGTNSRLSPKLGIAWQALAKYSSLLIITKYSKTFDVLSNKNAQVILWKDGEAIEELPPARNILICDYPYVMTDLEKALNAMETQPSTVTILHGVGTCDDALAMYCLTATGVPTEDEALALLRPDIT